MDRAFNVRTSPDCRAPFQHILLCCRNVAAKDSWPTLPGVTTLYELFENSVKKYPNNKCLGWRPIQDGKAQPYTFHTYKEVQGTF